jgi:hypothetical protein
MASSRFRFALKASISHLIASGIVAALAAALVFGFWYPFPYDHIVGGRHLFWLLISIDVVCGPLLTLLLFSPTKALGELLCDLILIVTVQLVAFGFGLHTLAHARPLALVYEVDRFRIVSFADIYESELAVSPAWLKPWSFSKPRLVGIRASQDGAELLKSVDLSLAGIEPSQRPSRWQDYSLNVPQVLQRVRSLSDLVELHPEQAAKLAQAVEKTGQSEASLRWLPVVSHNVTDWIVLIDERSGQVRGFANFDGF